MGGGKREGRRHDEERGKEMGGGKREGRRHDEERKT